MASVEMVQAVAPEVLEPGEPTLAELAERINRAHGGVNSALNDAVARALEAGEGLLQARAMVQWGEWSQWVATNCDLPYQSAVFYMRLARHRELTENATSMDEARQLTVGLGKPSYSQGPRHALVEEGRRLHRDGVGVVEIARILNVHRNTVKRWIDPAYHRREVARQRAASRRWDDARKAMRVKEQERALKRAVRKAGAATQEVYAMAERMQDVLAQAHRETEDREARQALSLAGEHYRKMRDHIVRALGVS